MISILPNLENLALVLPPWENQVDILERVQWDALNCSKLQSLSLDFRGHLNRNIRTHMLQMFNKSEICKKNKREREQVSVENRPNL